MTTSDTVTPAAIRAWASDQGMDVPARGRLPEEVREAYQVAHGIAGAVEGDQGEGDQGEAGTPFGIVLGGPVVEETPPRPVEETPPAAPPSSPIAKVKGKLRARAERAPAVGRGGKARKSLEGLVGGAWAVMAHFAGQGGQVPVARALTMQAPVAGVLMDEMLRGTLADRILQPLARIGDKSEILAALIGVPVLVAAIDNMPGLAPQLLPMLERSLESWAILAGPQLRKAEARRKRAAEELGASDISELLSQIFAPVPVDGGMGEEGGPSAAAA